MTRDDIIRMANEAGLYHFYDSEGHCTGITNARLVTEDKERDDDRLVEMLAPFAALVAAAEREACAKVCEDIEEAYRRQESIRYPALRTDAETGSEECAAAIRARNNT
jgi:carboxypeptidase C (cathepsin A)